MISPDDQQLELLLKKYYASEMPEGIRQLENRTTERATSSASVQMVARHPAPTQSRVQSMNWGLAVTATVLLLVLLSLNIPTATDRETAGPTPPVPADSDTPMSYPANKVPVEMRSPLRWVKKVETDPNTGSQVEYLVPEYDTRFKIFPLDEDEEVNE